MTIFSPATLPAVATRKSSRIRTPPSSSTTSAEKLPSCGLRFSVMSMSASTLKMLRTASPSLAVERPARLQHAVDAEADGHLLLGRLQVDVGGARLDRLVDQFQGRAVVVRLLRRGGRGRRRPRRSCCSCR